eukprot:SAG22_NODE_506_length_9643_cov_5.853206_7_plen_247_part_00
MHWPSIACNSAMQRVGRPPPVRRRTGAEAFKVSWEVAVEERERVAGFRVAVEAVRQQHVRPESHLPAPERRQRRRDDRDVLDVLGVGGGRDRRDVQVQAECHGAAGRRERDADRPAQQVAWRRVPLHPLAPVLGWELDGVASRQVERLVDPEHGLHFEVAVRHLCDRPERAPEHPGVDRDGLARPPAVDVDAERLGRLQPVAADLHTRLPPRGPGRRDRDHEAAVQCQRLMITAGTGSVAGVLSRG